MSTSRIKPNWRIVKVDQKGMCDESWIEERHVAACGVFYLLDANLHVHICSLTPTLEAWPMQGFATFDSDEAAEADEGNVEMEMLSSEQDPCSYFGTDILDKCPHRPATDYVAIPEQEEGEDDMHYRMRVADEAREYFCGNAVWFE